MKYFYNEQDNEILAIDDNKCISIFQEIYLAKKSKEHPKGYYLPTGHFEPNKPKRVHKNKPVKKQKYVEPTAEILARIDEILDQDDPPGAHAIGRQLGISWQTVAKRKRDR